ncbi:YceD family protein [Paenibacillus pini]|uniref:Ribosomal protein L32p n=1 Tax=Paenibacillus pini JCM 16418 TaxID=1236976 RepID=W7YQ46_9BACL|nr:DUF177 domain-containing protein [Paenibacillus pini]GAF06701.1 ribosomal protein L32p [Paenibacillus pini JCM 16418]
MQLQFRKMASSTEPLQFHQEVDVSRAVEGRDDVSNLQPLQADLKATYLGPLIPDTVDVQGKLSVQLDMVCARCLTVVHEHLHIPFHEQLKQGKQPEEFREEDDTIYVDNEIVDLVPLVEESFLLHLPQTVLCKSTCKGLCPNCGVDLNEGTCNCDKQRVDPRLEALQNFFK